MKAIIKLKSATANNATSTELVINNIFYIKIHNIDNKDLEIRTSQNESDFQLLEHCTYMFVSSDATNHEYNKTFIKGSDILYVTFAH